MPPHLRSRRRPLAVALLAGTALLTVPAGAAASNASPTPAGATTSNPPHVAGEVIVRYAEDADRSARAATQVETGTRSPEVIAERTRRLKVRPGQTVAQTLRRLRERDEVVWAVPNLKARIAQTPARPPFMPNDPGRGGSGGWTQLQWNFLAETGVNAPQAWANLQTARAPGGRGAVVAVLDTGVAYANRGRFRRSPDFGAHQFVRGHDFVDRDPYPNDHNGHGTHVAGTIAQRTNNRVGLTGLAYGARIMPVRVLDAQGEGDAAAISRGIRYAARRGAHVINLSLEFPSSVTRFQIPDILSAMSYANRRGSLIVGASGNEAHRAVAYPARAGTVMSVGAVTEHGCQADYSNSGADLDIVAPGGGADAEVRTDPAHCQPSADPVGRDIFQTTFAGSVRRFATPDGYQGTSMAAPHVSATAALVIASRVIGRRPTPRALKRHLQRTARDYGPPGFDRRYGAGMLDAAAATAPR
jgi:serine protease